MDLYATTLCAVAALCLAGGGAVLATARSAAGPVPSPSVAAWSTAGLVPAALAISLAQSGIVPFALRDAVGGAGIAGALLLAAPAADRLGRVPASLLAASAGGLASYTVSLRLLHETVIDEAGAAACGILLTLAGAAAVATLAAGDACARRELEADLLGEAPLTSASPGPAFWDGLALALAAGVCAALSLAPAALLSVTPPALPSIAVGVALATPAAAALALALAGESPLDATPHRARGVAAAGGAVLAASLAASLAAAAHAVPLAVVVPTVLVGGAACASAASALSSLDARAATAPLSRALAAAGVVGGAWLLVTSV